MKVLNERSAQIKFNRSFDKANQWGKATVTESVTNYYVTIHIFGYALPSVLDWKISKKEAANMGVLALADEQSATLIKGIIAESVPDEYEIKINK